MMESSALLSVRRHVFIWIRNVLLGRQQNQLSTWYHHKNIHSCGLVLKLCKFHYIVVQCLFRLRACTFPRSGSIRKLQCNISNTVLSAFLTVSFQISSFLLIRGMIAQYARVIYGRSVTDKDITISDISWVPAPVNIACVCLVDLT